MCLSRSFVLTVKAPPQYQRIKQYLLERIESGEFQPDHQIPPEEKLAVQFSVSRMTANKAIRDLVQEGYLIRQVGLGTFVTDRKAESPLTEVNNIADEVRQRGHDYHNEVVRCEAIAADDETALKLGVRMGAEVFHSVLIHFDNGRPIQLEDRYVNPKWVPDYLDTDFSQHTPNEILVARCPITDLEHVVEALLPDAQTAQWLDTNTGQPCLCMTRRTWSGEHLISYARLLHPGDRYKLRTTLSKKSS